MKRMCRPYATTASHRRLQQRRISDSADFLMQARDRLVSTVVSRNNGNSTLYSQILCVSTRHGVETKTTSSSLAGSWFHTKDRQTSFRFPCTCEKTEGSPTKSHNQDEQPSCYRNRISTSALHSFPMRINAFMSRKTFGAEET